MNVRDIKVKKNNLVLGASSFVGRDFCDYLRSCGELVIPFDIAESDVMDARSAVLPLGDVNRVSVD